MFDLTELKKIRKKLDMTQTEFAANVGVSQSMIAKIEYGKLDPSYTRAKKIFEAVEFLLNKESLKAKDIMTSGVIAVKPDDKIDKVVKIMKLRSISQLPVISEGIVSGLITESSILEKLSAGKLAKNAVASDLAESTPPIVSPTTTADAVYTLLKYSPLVLVSDKGRVKGVITKADAMLKILQN